MMVRQPDGFLTAMDGAEIPYRAWGDERSKHALVLLHGAGSHSYWYEALAQGLLKEGVATLAVDQRGFGFTAGPRGHSPRFSPCLDDCAVALSVASARWPLASVALAGHSFGGLVALRYCLDRAEKRGLAPSRLVLMAPWIKDQLPIRKRKIVEGVVRSVTAPTHTYPVPISVHETGDPENAEALAAVDADPHWVHELSGRWFVVTQRAKLGIMRQVRSLRLPILQVEAGQDALIEADTNRRLFARIGSVQKRLLVLPGFYHDMELQRDLDPLVACIVEFLARNFTAVA